MPFILTGCQVNEEAAENAESEIMRIVEEQQEAWNRGDIPGFMSAYDDNNELCFVTSNGLLKGHAVIQARYEKSYPNAVRMGSLSFDMLHFKQLGEDNAMLIGQWTLIRENDRPQGYFTLIWARTNEGWKIISDHTS